MAQSVQDEARLRGLLQNQPPLEGTGRCAGGFDHTKTLLFPTVCVRAVRDACIDALMCSYTFEDGSHYDGSWKNFLPHGKGTYTWPGGTVYTVCCLSVDVVVFIAPQACVR
jgi:hypothetical protein